MNTELTNYFQFFSIISYSLDTTEQKQGKSHVHMEVHDLDEFVAN